VTGAAWGRRAAAKRPSTIIRVTASLVRIVISNRLNSITGMSGHDCCQQA
jgi:hypothetical protein